MKKHMVHNFSFYIHKKNIQNTHKMKKKLNIKLIFFYQEKGESYLFYLKRGRMRSKNERMNLYITFYFFFKTKNKRRDTRVINKYNT